MRMRMTLVLRKTEADGDDTDEDVGEEDDAEDDVVEGGHPQQDASDELL